LKTTTKTNLSLGERSANSITIHSRRLVFVKTAQMDVLTCATCAWTFVPSGPPLGESLKEIMSNFERQRDTEFKSHVCAQHPKRLAVRERSSYSYQNRMEASTRTVAQAMNARA
jgi:hypothetical protein